jgi:hypothetical protein
MQDGIGEPAVEILAATAGARHERRLRRDWGLSVGQKIRTWK